MEMKLSRERVRQLEKAYQLHTKLAAEIANWRGDDWNRPVTHLGVSTRATNAFINEELDTIRDVQRWVFDPEVKPLKTVNLGVKTVKEIREAVGTPSEPVAAYTDMLDPDDLQSLHISLYALQGLRAYGVTSVSDLRALIEKGHLAFAKQVKLSPRVRRAIIDALTTYDGRLRLT